MNQRISLVLVSTLAFASPSFAQVALGTSPVVEVAPVFESEAPDTYGTTTPTAVVVGAYACDSFNPATAINPASGTPNRFLAAATFMICPFQVPSGATIISFELEACDTSTTGQVSAQLVRTTSPGGPGNTVGGTISTGAAAAPGCAFFPLTLAPGVQVNNGAEKYIFQVNNTTFDGTTQVGAIRARYRLNVSPAPALASFTDVPVGHPQRQFIEALVAAGITGGCGAGVYCPDAPLTRGQMAVFLSVALGLHFTP